MTTVTILEKVKTFLEHNVCQFVKLQKPNDDNVDNYELVYPSAHIGWIPPKGFLPPELEVVVPCLVVGMDEADDNGLEGDISLRISAVVYSPGLHKPMEGGEIECTPDFQGYNDLLNLIDRTVAEIAKHQILNGVPIEYPIKWGMHQETQPYPYWYGWISFSVKKQSYPKALVDL